MAGDVPIPAADPILLEGGRAGRDGERCAVSVGRRSRQWFCRVAMASVRVTITLPLAARHPRAPPPLLLSLSLPPSLSRCACEARAPAPLHPSKESEDEHCPCALLQYGISRAGNNGGNDRVAFHSIGLLVVRQRQG